MAFSDTKNWSPSSPLPAEAGPLAPLPAEACLQPNGVVSIWDMSWTLGARPVLVRLQGLQGGGPSRWTILDPSWGPFTQASDSTCRVGKGPGGGRAIGCWYRKYGEELRIPTHCGLRPIETGGLHSLRVPFALMACAQARHPPTKPARCHSLLASPPNK